jgi:predicted permease
MGRAFAPDEDSGRNAHPVTVISYDLWQRRYRGDQQIIGKTQLLNGQPHTIIGVGPKGFSGTFVGWATDFWVPVSMQERFDPPAYKLEDRRERWIEGYVLLKAGVTPQQAQQEISAAAQRLAEAFPATNRGRGVKLFPLWQTPFNGAGEMLPTLGIALAVVFFVLLVACANVSNLMLLRGLARRHEMTVRVAIGASRGRLVRQLLTEGAALSLIASVIGLLLARWLRDGLVLLLPARGGLKMHFPGEIDWRVLGVSIGICALATLLFALVPSINATRIDVAATLKTEAAMTMSGKRSGSMRSALVVVQIAFSFALLVGTGLLITSLRRMHTETPGFSEDDVVITAIDFSSAGYDLQRTRDFQQQLIDRVEALPGVRSAAFARVPPFSYRSYSLAPVTTATSTQPVTELPTVEYDEVGPGYLRTLGIARVSGREFTRADDENAPPVAIVNDTLAAQLWPGQDAVGQKFSAGGKWRTVVGVARTTRYRSLTETPQRFFYVPLRQGPVAPVLHVRTILPPSQIAGALAQAIHALDANIAPQEIITMREQVDRTIAPQRMALKMISGFAALALVLTAVGLYGVMSYAVAQSTREFGVRIAVGAARGDLVRMVLMRGIRFSIAGVVFGATIALACSRLLGYLLYKVSPRDPAIFALALVLITIAAVAASVVPAWRASQIDVLTALRA